MKVMEGKAVKEIQLAKGAKTEKRVNIKTDIQWHFYGL